MRVLTYTIMPGMFHLGRITLQICVYNSIGSKKIPRAMMENVFGKWDWDELTYSFCKHVTII